MISFFLRAETFFLSSLSSNSCRHVNITADVLCLKWIKLRDSGDGYTIDTMGRYSFGSILAKRSNKIYANTFTNDDFSSQSNNQMLSKKMVDWV